MPEPHRHVLGLGVGQQLNQHVSEAERGIRGHAVGAHRLPNGVIGAEYIARTVDQIEVVVGLWRLRGLGHGGTENAGAPGKSRERKSDTVVAPPGSDHNNARPETRAAWIAGVRGRDGRYQTRMDVDEHG